MANPRQRILAALVKTAMEELGVTDVVLLVRQPDSERIELGISPQCKYFRSMLGDALLDMDGLLERAGLKHKAET